MDDEYNGNTTNEARQKTCLRMNVTVVKELSDKLIEKGIQVDYQVHQWGTVAKFRDPAGNLLAFKDSGKFEKQVNLAIEKG